jgi:nicotinate-nucleotide pyrophosphorylase (carboxylating)
VQEDIFESPEVHSFILQALKEDIKDGDHTTLSCIPETSQGKVKLLFKEDGVVAGLKLAHLILEQLDENINIEFFKTDGDNVKKGETGFIASGKIHALLMGERLLLNCLQRLSGIASMTRMVVDQISPYHSKLLDTRKTTPNFRFLEKWAVTVGGGFNHRMGLYDMVMLKDNHVDFAGGITEALLNARDYLVENDLPLKIEIETRNLDEVKKALSADCADRIMLDNFSPEEITEALKVIDGKCETEASGGITSENIEEYAKTGVDFISMGALTHSYTSLDMSLKFLQ